MIREVSHVCTYKKGFVVVESKQKSQKLTVQLNGDFIKIRTHYHS